MLRVAGLTLSYDDRIILNDLNFEIRAGEFVGILGPNGCGKSTLLAALTGLLPPRAGQIWYDGLSLHHWRPRPLARQVALVPQSNPVTFPFTCWEMVLMGRYPYRHRFQGDSDADIAAAQRAMVQTRTTLLAQRLITLISGGERQQVILARALAQTTPVLLLDEATASLDIRRKLEIFALLRQLNHNGLTVLAVMHDINLAAMFCQRLLFLKDGRIFCDGATSEVCTREILEAVYETPVLVECHPAIGRPQVLFLPQNQEDPDTKEQGH